MLDGRAGASCGLCLSARLLLFPFVLEAEVPVAGVSACFPLSAWFWWVSLGGHQQKGGEAPRLSLSASRKFCRQ